METVPNVVQEVNIEAEIQQSEQKNICNLFFYAYLSRIEIKHAENQREYTAVNVGQNVIAAASYSCLGAGEMVSEEIKGGKVFDNRGGMSAARCRSLGQYCDKREYYHRYKQRCRN